jgi:ABC-type phosphate/phosphonate transport system substrate-binding protein
MQTATGMHCAVKPPAGADELADLLMKDELQFAVFQGVEFAWEQQKHPKLSPLVIAVNQSRERRAQLVVKKDCLAHGWSDLRGKDLAIPRRSRDHCFLFCTRHCQENGTAPRQFFSRITKPASVEEALDDVVDGDVPAAVVDQIGLKAYERRKPGRWARLKVLCTSEPFPDTVVAYHAGALDKKTLEHCREGLVRADETKIGQLLLSMWMITHFEQVPAGFDKLLSDIRKV